MTCSVGEDWIKIVKKILILMGRYLPGHRDGGPLRTMINVTEALGDEYAFYIGCYDRDHGDEAPYPGIKTGKWYSVGKARVFYVEPGGFTCRRIEKLAKNKDMIYLCNFYESYGYKTLFLKRIQKLRCPVAVASMGVFSKEAQAQKALKKKIFIWGCKALGLFRSIPWSVTSELEGADVKRVMGKNAVCMVAEDLPRANVPGRARGFEKTLKIVFLSRICEHKNPMFLIQSINRMKNRNIEVGFYGPIQEKDYWNACLSELEKSDFKWMYGGDVPSERVQDVLAEYDVLALPSKSENYGHVVFEALSVGCIPVISDRTPWGNIERKKAGFICALDQGEFARTLDHLAQMDRNRIMELSDHAVSYARDKVKESRKTTGYRDIFG